jgi:glyoxylase-like metal-dependent hydrolase (beta-lactamase superfamily II)
VFESDLRVIHTPGHTKGSISLYSLSQGVLFSGDTLFFEGIGRTDTRDGDAKAILSSIQKKLITLPPETRVFPGHGPFTTIEREIKNNPYIRV